MNEITAPSGFDDFIEETQALGIIIKSYSQISSITSAHNDKIIFTAREIVNLDTQAATYDILIEFERSNQHPLSGSASIPYDEIERFIVGTRRLMRGGSHGVWRLKNFEAHISSVDGEVRLIVFNSANGSIRFAIKISNVSMYFNNISQMATITECLMRTKQEIDRIKICPY